MQAMFGTACGLPGTACGERGGEGLRGLAAGSAAERSVASGMARILSNLMSHAVSGSSICARHCSHDAVARRSHASAGGNSCRRTPGRPRPAALWRSPCASARRRAAARRSPTPSRSRARACAAAGKPFEAGESAAARAAHGAPNFNFNVAHDACLVVLAAVPRCRTHIPVCHRWRARSNRRYQAAASQSLACAAAHCAS